MTDKSGGEVLIRYPESFGAMATHLSFLLGNEVRNRETFEATIPTVIPQLVHFFEMVHSMHESALRILREDKPFALYLRHFVSAGTRFANPSSSPTRRDQIGLTWSDLRMQQFVSQQLEGVLPVISCFNNLDLWPKGTKVQPVLRLLSHTWQRTIQALVDGAQCIVLFMTSPGGGKAGQGVEFEMAQIKQFGQKDRCIFLLDTERTDAQSAGFDVHASFGWRSSDPDWDQIKDACDFGASLRALARQGPARQKMCGPFNYPACYVVDRDLDGQYVAEAQAAGYDYTSLIPETLAGNAEAEQIQYRHMMQHRQEMAERMERKQSVDRDEMISLMYQALTCFALATTLEHYEPMAHSLSAVGIAHEYVTGGQEIRRLCMDGAAKFARYAGDEESGQYFAQGAGEAEGS